jgi:hypothetical protein
MRKLEFERFWTIDLEPVQDNPDPGFINIVTMQKITTLSEQFLAV